MHVQSVCAHVRPPMRVLVVSEFYPRRRDPVIGFWAHRQALAARDAGADVRVCVLHRPLPAQADARDRRAWRAALDQPRHVVLDGLPVDYVPFLSPPRPGSYGAWGSYAAASLVPYLRAIRRRFPYDLVHAHNAVPAGEAVRRADGGRVPLVVSVHGADVLYTAPTYASGRTAVARTFAAARLVLANSAGTARMSTALGARDVRVVHLGADLPAVLPPRDEDPTLVSVAHLVGRKRHADVLRALWLLRDTRPRLRYRIVGDGPERPRIAALARELGLERRLELTGQLPNAAALDVLHRGHVMALPSVDEAFGVAYVEAMAGGVPAIGSLGEPGPRDIAEAGPGLTLVPPGDPGELAEAITTLLDDRGAGADARETVRRHFTWDACGERTVAAYATVLA